MAEKTIIPGMPTGPEQQKEQTYSSRGTVCPGMPAGSNEAGNGRPLMGFLYSVSKTPLGQYWPLYVGANTIGRDAGNTVVLNEASVSGSHATLVIRKLLHNGQNAGLSVFIQDTCSTTGTMLNDCTIDFNPQPCKTGDIIKIGPNYELYLIIINADEIGLKTNHEFMPASQEPVSVPLTGKDPYGNWNNPPVSRNANTKGTLMGANGFANPSYNSGYQQNSDPFENRKATIYMPNKE